MNYIDLKSTINPLTESYRRHVIDNLTLKINDIVTHNRKNLVERNALSLSTLCNSEKLKDQRL
jgi:hypothetical protein